VADELAQLLPEWERLAAQSADANAER